MKFIHIADVHLGAEPDVGGLYSESRPRELWDALDRVLRICEKEQTDLLLIAGDLFHRQPLIRELKKVDSMFAALTHTKVVLIAGNHDYIGPNSYYRTFTWSDNVFPLFGTEPQVAMFKELDTAVYGFSYGSREIREARYDNLVAERRAKNEILLAHGGDEKHVPIQKQALAKSGFGYIALGHIHRAQVLFQKHALYAGALEPIDKNDIGKHGYIRGEMKNGIVRTAFVPNAKREYFHLEIPVTADMSERDIHMSISQTIQDYGNENLYQFFLCGERDADLEFNLEQWIFPENVLEVVDETKPAYDLEKLKRIHSDNLIGKYIALFDGCEEGSIDQQAMYEGLHALLDHRL